MSIRTKVDPRRVIRNVVIAALPALLTVALAAGSGVALAAGGYGPIGTGPSGTPGGFTAVVATQSFGTAGGVLKTRIGAARIDVRLPAHTFATGGTQIEITEPDLAALGRALPRLGLHHVHVVAGIGVAFLSRNGKTLSASRFRHPVTIIFQAQGFSGQVRVLEFSGPNKVHALRVTHLGGKPAQIAVTVTGGGNLFVVA